MCVYDDPQVWLVLKVFVMRADCFLRTLTSSRSDFYDAHEWASSILAEMVPPRVVKSAC